MEEKNKITQYSIEYEFFDETKETEIRMIVEGQNILAFRKNKRILSTRWNLNDLVDWIRTFIDHMSEDPFPYVVKGEYAAEKDFYAHQFDTDDEKEFDEYYDNLDEWNLRHRWHTASNGAVLADVYFQLVNKNVEISWNNIEEEDGIDFLSKTGGAKIPKETFVKVVEKFLNDYADHWFA